MGQSKLYTFNVNMNHTEKQTERHTCMQILDK